jgi:hypothetical protein
VQQTNSSTTSTALCVSFVLQQSRAPCLSSVDVPRPPAGAAWIALLQARSSGSKCPCSSSNFLRSMGRECLSSPRQAQLRLFMVPVLPEDHISLIIPAAQCHICLG